MPAQHIASGNVHIQKTVAINRSTQRYVFVLLLAATLALLFLDWSVLHCRSGSLLLCSAQT